MTTGPFGRQGTRFILTPEQIERYHQDGYIVLENVCTDDEVAQIEAFYMPFIRGEVPDMGRDFCDMSGPYDRAFEDFNLINAMLPRKYNPAIQNNIAEQLSQSIADQLIASEAVLDYDQFLAKRPTKAEAAFAMHQDLGYWPVGAPNDVTTTCSLALDDADTDNGCLMVVPGSHLEEELRPHVPVFETDNADNERDGGHALQVELTPQDKVVELRVPRGGMSVHNERIVHGSGGNNSERWRRTYVIAHRTKDCVDYERSIGFTHSHNDQISWETHIAGILAGA